MSTEHACVTHVWRRGTSALLLQASPQQFLRCSIVHSLEHLVLSVCCFPSHCLLTPIPWWVPKTGNVDYLIERITKLAAKPCHSWPTGMHDLSLPHSLILALPSSCKRWSHHENKVTYMANRAKANKHKEEEQHLSTVRSIHTCQNGTMNRSAATTPQRAPPLLSNHAGTIV